MSNLKFTNLRFEILLMNMLKFLACTFFLSTVSGCNHLFYFPHSKIYLTPDKAQLKYRDVSIKVDQDVTLKAWHISPDEPRVPKVAIMQFHGNAQNRSTHFLSVAWMAEQGIDVVTFDYRGYDGSTGTPSRSGLIDDGVAALKWFEREFPKTRKYVIGQSLGGAVAIPAIVKSGIHLDGLILESTFHSYRGIARLKLSSNWLTWPFQWLPWILLSGNENPIDAISELTTPVLVFHDRYDPVVDYESGALLYEKRPAATTRVFVNDGDRHAAAFSEDRPENRTAALKFIGAE